MRNKNKLKNLHEIICINNELTKKEREMQYKLNQMAEAERRKGKNVKTEYQNITIYGKDWRWDDETRNLRQQKQTDTKKDKVRKWRRLRRRKRLRIRL